MSRKSNDPLLGPVTPMAKVSVNPNRASAASGNEKGPNSAGQIQSAKEAGGRADAPPPVSKISELGVKFGVEVHKNAKRTHRNGAPQSERIWTMNSGRIDMSKL